MRRLGRLYDPEVRRLLPGLLVCTVTLGQEPVHAWTEVEPLLRQHCYDCHDRDRQKGRLDLEQLPGVADLTWLATLAKMRDRVAAGEMPPPDKAHLDAAERGRLAQWLSRMVRAGVPALPPAPGRVTIRRLSRAQYENTVRELLAVDSDLKERLPEDTRRLGFDNVGEALQLSSAQLEAYLEAADEALDAAFVRGPQPVSQKRRNARTGSSRRS